MDLKKERFIRIFQAVVSLYNVAKTRVRVGSSCLEEFAEKVAVHQGSVLSPLFFNKLLYAD